MINRIVDDLYQTIGGVDVPAGNSMDFVLAGEDHPLSASDISKSFKNRGIQFSHFFGFTLNFVDGNAYIPQIKGTYYVAIYWGQTMGDRVAEASWTTNPNNNVIGGSIVFDENREWDIGKFFKILGHEIAHILDIGHNNNLPHSFMNGDRALDDLTYYGFLACDMAYMTKRIKHRLSHGTDMAQFDFDYPESEVISNPHMVKIPGTKTQMLYVPVIEEKSMVFSRTLNNTTEIPAWRNSFLNENVPRPVFVKGADIPFASEPGGQYFEDHAQYQFTERGVFHVQYFSDVAYDQEATIRLDNILMPNGKIQSNAILDRISENEYVVTRINGQWLNS